MKKNNINLLAISIGVVYLWFGLLKFFPALSPAEGLAKNTIDSITLGFIPDNVSIILLALWETIVGAFLILGLFRRTAVILALVHMVCTFVPLVIFPGETFNEGPLYLTLLGQYIIKNLIIVAALVVLYREEAKYSRSVLTEGKQLVSLLGAKLNFQKFLLKNRTSAAKSAPMQAD